jgi:hypothetical protein
MGKEIFIELWINWIGRFFSRILHTAREKRTNEKDRVDYIFIKQEQYEEDVTKVCDMIIFRKNKINDFTENFRVNFFVVMNIMVIGMVSNVHQLKMLHEKV